MIEKTPQKLAAEWLAQRLKWGWRFKWKTTDDGRRFEGFPPGGAPAVFNAEMFGKVVEPFLADRGVPAGRVFVEEM